MLLRDKKRGSDMKNGQWMSHSSRPHTDGLEEQLDVFDFILWRRKVFSSVFDVGFIKLNKVFIKPGDCVRVSELISPSEHSFLQHKSLF